MSNHVDVRISIQGLCAPNPANASVLFLESQPFFSSKLTQPNGTSFFFFKISMIVSLKGATCWENKPNQNPQSLDRGEEGFWRDLVNLSVWKKDIIERAAHVFGFVVGWAIGWDVASCGEVCWGVLRCDCFLKNSHGVIFRMGCF